MPVDIEVTTNSSNQIVLSPDDDGTIETEDGSVKWRVEALSNIKDLEVLHDNGSAPDPPVTPSAPSGGATETSLTGSAIGTEEDVDLTALLIGGGSVSRAVKVIRVA